MDDRRHASVKNGALHRSDSLGDHAPSLENFANQETQCVSPQQQAPPISQSPQQQATPTSQSPQQQAPPTSQSPQQQTPAFQSPPSTP